MPSNRVRIAALVVMTVSLFVAGAAQAAVLTKQSVATGLNRPIYVTYAPGDTTRLFIIEQRGVIKILDLTTNTVLATPFLDIDASIITISGNEERGLLGLTFHPDYFSNGYFFIAYVRSSDNHDIVARYQVSGDPATSNVANAASASIIVDNADPFTNHNGSWMGFGPLDGYLYVSMGDGGSGCDPSQRAQNLSQMFGKMWRIDPDGPDNIFGNADDDDYPGDATKNFAIPPTNPFAGGGGLGEIWAYGLRNPWRCCFDRMTGDLYIADVGQDWIEEIDFQPGGSSGGQNYGWDCREGTSCSNSVSGSCSGSINGCVCASVSSIDPIWQYDHNLGISISGGAVYRGCRIPKLQGMYFFADFSSNRIWSFTYPGTGTVASATLRSSGGTNELTGITSIPSIGEDAAGEIYIVQRGTGANGVIYRLTTVNAGPGDINADNAVTELDADILVKVLLDIDPGDPAYICRSDVNSDGTVDGNDIQAWIDQL